MNFVEVHCNHLGIFSSYSPDLLPNDMQVIQLRIWSCIDLGRVIKDHEAFFQFCWHHLSLSSGISLIYRGSQIFSW